MLEVTNDTVLLALQSKFGLGILASDTPYGMLTIEAESEINIDILRFLYEHPDFKIQFMTDICGIHLPDQELELGVVYHLHSLVNNFRLRVKFFLPKSTPEIKSATEMYAAANWMERETFDFYGIIFTGHPDLRRILNVDDMVAFPMRKEFPLEDPNRIDKKDYFFGR